MALQAFFFLPRVYGYISCELRNKREKKKGAENKRSIKSWRNATDYSLFDVMLRVCDIRAIFAEMLFPIYKCKQLEGECKVMDCVIFSTRLILKRRCLLESFSSAYISIATPELHRDVNNVVTKTSAE